MMVTKNKLLNHVLVVLALLLALVIFDIVTKGNRVKEPTYKHIPTDTTKTKSITDETWFWLMLASS